MNTNHLTRLRDQMLDDWFVSLRIGDKVHNYSPDRPDRGTTGRLREGIIKEIHDGGKFNRFVIVDNLTTGRQNKWGDYELVKPKEVQNISDIMEKQAAINRENHLTQKPEKTKQTTDEKKAQAEYKLLMKEAKEHLKNEDIQLGNCVGIYGAFNKNTNECIYIGKSGSSIKARWRAHERFWKKDKPIHRQQLFTQYLYFFKDKIEWKVLLPIDDSVSNDLVEYTERRLFEKYRPIANSIVPNGTFFGRSVMEGGGESIIVSEWSPNMVNIRIHKGQFNGFSDGKDHFRH